MVEIIKTISVFAIPVFMIFILLYGYIKGVPVYETFIDGAKEGFTTSIRILPYLVAMFAAIGIFRSSGTMEFLIGALKPVLKYLGMPPEVLPLAIIRPISGAASIGVLGEILNTYSPDSQIGRIASTVMGSQETTFYTLSIYYGSVGIKKIKYTLWAALFADLIGVVASVLVCNLFFY